MPVFLARCWLDSLTLNFHFAFMRNTDLQLLVENNQVLDELTADPELSWSDRFFYQRPGGIFQRIARFESLDRDMLFA